MVGPPLRWASLCQNPAEAERGCDKLAKEAVERSACHCSSPHPPGNSAGIPLFIVPAHLARRHGMAWCRPSGVLQRLGPPCPAPPACPTPWAPPGLLELGPKLPQSRGGLGRTLACSPPTLHGCPLILNVSGRFPHKPLSPDHPIRGPAELPRRWSCTNSTRGREPGESAQRPRGAAEAQPSLGAASFLGSECCVHWRFWRGPVGPDLERCGDSDPLPGGWASTAP